LIKRVFWAAGPGDIIDAHRYWKRNEPYPTEVSLTFSGQIEDFCKEIGAKAYFVATHRRKDYVNDGDFIMEHRPKRAHSGLRYHLTEIAYGLGLLRTALWFKADVALIDSGCTHYFVCVLFRLLGIRVVPILHNSLWPNGFPPRRLIPRLVTKLDSLFFWPRIPTAVIGVSPECGRQVDELRGKKRYAIFQTRAQFYADYFAKIPPHPPHETRPFQMMFIGRVDRIKGVFDILDIARRIENSHPGLVRWEVCGRGRDFDELSTRHAELRLADVVNLRGWTSLEDLIGVYAKTHACIVPTRSSFTEGLAMTAAEAILAGRPVVTNPVVPALEVLRLACVEAKTDDADSHLEAVLKFATDAELYGRACAACHDYQPQFYDRKQYGLNAVLQQALRPYL
jgi:glycosyltransferase involved in cell wall biosynthesis